MNRLPKSDEKRTLAPALASSVLCWLAFPPVGWGWLAWIAPIGWLSLVQREHLLGGRPYRKIWLAGFVFWTLTLHWLRLPHPLNYFLLVMLASYLACYLPAFVALSRVGVHRLRLPLWLIAPVVWTALDWIRGHFMTGFLMGSLAHTQVGTPTVIQISNLCGEYGVTFLIVLVAACLTQSLMPVDRLSTLLSGGKSLGEGLGEGLEFIKDLPSSSPYLQGRGTDGVGRRLWPVIVGMVALVSALLYGKSEQEEFALPLQGQPGPRVALIQGHTLADWKFDDDRQLSIVQEYARLSQAAVEQSRQRDGRDVDLIVWPETAYRYPLYTIADGYRLPTERFPESSLNAAKSDLAEFVRQHGAGILTGIERVHWFADQAGEPAYEQFNSSVLINKQAEIVGTYDKMHLVIMGEYVPFTSWLPILKRLTPITGLATPGVKPAALAAEGFVYCPNICYETAVPHLIRRQVTELTATGKHPDALVNLTNDAWFWGSSELDMHLACGIFRAVEMRLPLIIAANGGLSAHIDTFGNVQQMTPRQQTATLLVDLRKRTSNELTAYAKRGDWFAGLCVICCMVLAIVGWRDREPATP